MWMKLGGAIASTTAQQQTSKEGHNKTSHATSSPCAHQERKDLGEPKHFTHLNMQRRQSEKKWRSRLNSKTTRCANRAQDGTCGTQSEQENWSLILHILPPEKVGLNGEMGQNGKKMVLMENSSWVHQHHKITLKFSSFSSNIERAS